MRTNVGQPSEGCGRRGQLLACQTSEQTQTNEFVAHKRKSEVHFAFEARTFSPSRFCGQKSGSQIRIRRSKFECRLKLRLELLLAIALFAFRCLAAVDLFSFAHNNNNNQHQRHQQPKTTTTIGESNRMTAIGANLHCSRGLCVRVLPTSLVCAICARDGDSAASCDSRNSILLDSSPE